MVTIDKTYMLTAAEAKKVSYGPGNTKEFLCIHTTDNYNVGAKALNHAKLQKNGNSRQASWHYQVDDIKAYQSFPNNYRCWHAGAGNNKSIAIEICVDKGSDWNKTMRNAVQLAAKILKDEKIPINKMVQHNYFTGKNCPRDIREGKGGWTWNKFVSEVKKELSGTSKPPNANKEKQYYKPSDGLGLYRIIKDCYLYPKPKFVEKDRIKKIKKGEALTALAIVKEGNGYRLKTKYGYVTANKEFVQKV